MIQKSYLKYNLQHTAGVIASVDSDVCFSTSGKEILTGGLESVNVFSSKSGQLRRAFSDAGLEGVAVTRVASSPEAGVYAVGYTDGSIRIWSVQSKEREELLATFSGHSKAVTALAFSSDGTFLASGSLGTDVLVWDVLGQSGKARLRGHKGAVTCVRFTDQDTKLVSSSKDALVLVWDLSIQMCIQTLIGHRHEVWTFVIDEQRKRLVTGSADNKLRVWKMDDPLKYEYYGTVDRSLEHRVVSIALSGADAANPTRLVVQSVSKVVEVFNLQDEAARQKKMKRRLKREKTKMERKVEDLKSNVGVPGFDFEAEVSKLKGSYEAAPKASDEVVAAYAFGVSHKLHRMAVLGNRVVLLTNRNEFAMYRVGSKEATLLLTVDQNGHRSDIRALALNSNDSRMLSTSGALAKVWAVESPEKCLSTVKLSGSALCAVYLPLDKHVVVGTKEGKLDLLSMASSSVMETFNAHSGAVWDVKITPDGKGIATASADKTVKFWDFAVRKSGGESQLTLVLSRTLQLSDDVLAVCFSPDGRLVAASLLDSTIKVHHLDTLNFFLSLYGHKLPVLSLSISSDSTLLVSASADKNVKIWGLDFGDCHKSMFAHDDAVTRIQFLAETHYFLTCSKDGTIKYWDADRFEQVTTMRAHHSEVWCLAVSSVGDFFVTGSHDRSLRVWAQSEELLFPESEKQKEMDKLFAPSLHELQNAVNVEFKDELRATDSGIVGLEGQVSGAAIQTLSSVKNSEKLNDAIDLAFDQHALLEDWRTACRVAEQEALTEERELKRRRNEPLLPPPEKNPLLLGMSPPDYLAHVLFRIPLGELEACLALLSFSSAMRLLGFAAVWLGDASFTQVEIVCRTTFYLIRLHLRELTQAKKYRTTLAKLQQLCRDRLLELKDAIAFNVAGATHAKRQLSADVAAAELFQAATILREKKRKAREKEKTRAIIF